VILLTSPEYAFYRHNSLRIGTVVLVRSQRRVALEVDVESIAAIDCAALVGTRLDIIRGQKSVSLVTRGRARGVDVAEELNPAVGVLSIDGCIAVKAVNDKVTGRQVRGHSRCASRLLHTKIGGDVLTLRDTGSGSRRRSDG